MGAGPRALTLQKSHLSYTIIQLVKKSPGGWQNIFLLCREIISRYRITYITVVRLYNCINELNSGIMAWFLAVIAGLAVLLFFSWSGLASMRLRYMINGKWKEANFDNNSAVEVKRGQYAVATCDEHCGICFIVIYVIFNLILPRQKQNRQLYLSRFECDHYTCFLSPSRTQPCLTSSGYTLIYITVMDKEFTSFHQYLKYFHKPGTTVFCISHVNIRA